MLADEIGWKNGGDFWISGLARLGPKVQKPPGVLSVAKRAFGDSIPKSLRLLKLRMSLRATELTTEMAFDSLVCQACHVCQRLFGSMDKTDDTRECCAYR
jgi:hypothetical protein